MSRPRTTLVFVSDAELVRADLSGGRLEGLERQERLHDVDDLGLLVEAALRLGGRPGRRVWVLAADAWTQVLELPTSGTRGLQGEELEQALKFEAEPLSGLPALESALAAVPLRSRGSRRAFWVTQLARGDLHEVEAVVGELGGSLAGIVHPAGLPAPLAGGAGPWRRAELWPTLSLDLEGDGAGQLEVAVDAPDPPGLLGALEPSAELLLGVGAAVRDGVGERPTFDLAEGPQLEAWLVAWAQALEGGGPAPRLTPARRPLSRSLRTAASAALALVVAAGCLFDYDRDRRQVAALEQELAALKDAAQAASRLETQEQALVREVDQLRRALDASAQALRAQRLRAPRLLAALAEAPAGLVVQGIDDRGREIVVRGLAPTPQLPNELAASLAERLAELDWRVDPPRSLVERGGAEPMWSFELSIRDPHVTASPLRRPAGRSEAAPRARSTRGRTSR